MFELVRPSKTDDEATKKTFTNKLTALAKIAKPGDITTIPTKDGTNRIYVMGSAGKWLQQ